MFALLAFHVPGPDVFGDELFYMEAGTSLAHHGTLEVRGEPYRFGPAFPAVVAVVLAAVDDRSAAYQWILAVNGLIVATAAIPLFLLARRILAPWPAAAVAGVGLLLPVSFYAAYVMTECLGYVVALWALLAIQLGVERASPQRQLLALGACALATAVRFQYVVLVPTYLAAAIVVSYLDGSWPGVRQTARRLRPTLIVLGVGAVAVVAPSVIRGDPQALLGGYSVLWRSYNPFTVVRWVAYDTLGLALYLLFVPVVLLPGIVSALFRAGRAGDRRAAAFLALFASATVFALLLVGVFSSTTFGEGRLHDRYIVYTVPLWLVAVGGWAARGAPVRRRASLVVSAVLAGLIVVSPLELVVFRGAELFDAVGTVPWAVTHELAGGGAVIGYTITLTGLALATFVSLRSDRSRVLALGVGCLVLMFSAWGMWARAIGVGGKGVFVGATAGERLWIDRAAGGGEVTGLFHAGRRCRVNDTRSAYWVSEFFNERVVRVASLGAELGGNLPELRLSRDPRGFLFGPSDGALRAELVLAPRSLVLAGQRVATGTTSHLSLWRVDGPVRVVRTVACPRRRPSGLVSSGA